MREIILAVKGEYIKIKTDFTYWIICIIPILYTFAMAIVIVMDDDLPVVDFWKYFANDVSMFYAIIYPALIALAVYHNVDMEIKNHTNKFLFCLPISHKKLYFAKSALLFVFYTASMIIAYSSFLLSVFALKQISPVVSEGLLKYNSHFVINLFFIKSYLLLIPLIFFLQAICLYLPKIWFPTSIAFSMYIAGLFAFNSEYWYTLPNASLTRLAWIELRHGQIALFDKSVMLTIIYTIFFACIGYIPFKKLKYR